MPARKRVALVLAVLGVIELLLAARCSWKHAPGDDLAEAGVVAANRDRDEGGVLVQIPLLQLRQLPRCALLLEPHIVGAGTGARDHVVVHARAPRVIQFTDGDGFSGQGRLPGPGVLRPVTGVA